MERKSVRDEVEGIGSIRSFNWEEVDGSSKEEEENDNNDDDEDDSIEEEMEVERPILEGSLLHF